MDRSLLFYSTCVKKISDQFSGYLLLLFLTALFSFSATVRAQENKTVENGGHNKQSITFFVSDNVILYGEDHVYYGKIERGSTVKKEGLKKAITAKKKNDDQGSLRKPVSKKVAAAKITKNHQGVFPVNFTSGSGENSFTQGCWRRISAVSPPVNNYTANPQPVLNAHLLSIHSVGLEMEQKKYGSCLSYLHRLQFKNSFRRGPPFCI